MAEYALAMLVDFENMARPGAKSRGDFDITLVLDRLNEKGRVIVKRAYADWSRYREAKHQLQNAGLELIEMPSAREGAKNRADIKLAVDAMELAYSREHVDNFVIVSGDSDFTPLVGKLRELNKRVIGVGNRESTSELLIANCDEFIFYDSIAGARGSSRRSSSDVGTMLKDTLLALQREGVEWPLASVVKDSMRRKNPAFDERDAGYSTFSKLLDEASAKGLVRLETDPRSGTYRVELADSGAGALPAAPAGGGEDRGEADRSGRRRRRRPPRSGEEGRSDEARGERRDDPLGDLPPGAEVFEVVVQTTPDLDMGELPPVGQPVTYEDMILMGPEVEAEVPELIQRADLDRVEGEQPSRGSRRRRRRYSTDDEPTASDLETLREDDDGRAPESSGPVTLEPLGADAIRAAFAAGEPVRFTVEEVEHASADSLGVATVEDGQVIRSWTNAAGKAERRASKTIDLGVKLLATGRKGAFRAVAVAAAPEAPVTVAEPVETPVSDPGAADAATDAPSPGRRRRRRASERPAEESGDAAVSVEPAEAQVAEVAEPTVVEEPAPPPRRRRVSRAAAALEAASSSVPGAEAPPETATPGPDPASGDAEPAPTSGRRRRRRTSPPPAAE